MVHTTRPSPLPSAPHAQGAVNGFGNLTRYMQRAMNVDETDACFIIRDGNGAALVGEPVDARRGPACRKSSLRSRLHLSISIRKPGLISRHFGVDDVGNLPQRIDTSDYFRARPVNIASAHRGSF
jgi:hypothetical protein